MKAVIWLAVLVFVCVPGIAQSSAIPLLEVPSGTAPTLDGTLANTEWDDALALDLSEATTLYVKHSGGFLYVGVRAPSDAQVIGNVYIARGEAIEILHASHAPGPASYLLGEETWRLAQPFLWSCRTLGFSEAALAERATFLEGNGWVATVVNLGRPEEMEYQIRVAETPLRMLFRFDVHRDSQEVLTWPLDTDVGITPGALPEEATFDPEAWTDVTLNLSPENAVHVPHGSEPMLDGTLSEGEWGDASQIDLDDDTVLRLKHAGGAIYLGLSAQAVGIPSACILRGEDVWVLHASGALGMAVYGKTGETWTKTRAFEWRCRTGDYDAAAASERETFLEEEGWLATIGYLGAQRNFEFQIELFGETSLPILFLFLDARSPMRIVSWPIDLSSFPVYTHLVLGPFPPSVSFDITSWAELQLE